MYRHILIATDGSDIARRAEEQGIAVARALGATVTALMVTERFPANSPVMLPSTDDVRRYEGEMAKGAGAVLARVGKAATAAGVACATLHIPDGSTVESILTACQQEGCDLVVMATHGRRGIDRLLLGSQAMKVMTASTVPVLICR